MQDLFNPPTGKTSCWIKHFIEWNTLDKKCPDMREQPDSQRDANKGEDDPPALFDHVVPELTPVNDSIIVLVNLALVSFYDNGLNNDPAIKSLKPVLPHPEAIVYVLKFAFHHFFFLALV
jgi:hypothetical protein